MRLVPFVIEEEVYEDTSWSSSGRFIRDDVDDFYLLSYDEFIWIKYTSFHGKIFNGNNSKESF